LGYVIDIRQRNKIKHSMGDIVAIVFFASLANANEWTEIYDFAEEHEAFLKKYLELSNGIPSQDTIQRVFAMVSPEFLQSFQQQWNESFQEKKARKSRKYWR